MLFAIAMASSVPACGTSRYDSVVSSGWKTLCETRRSRFELPCCSTLENSRKAKEPATAHSGTARMEKVQVGTRQREVMCICSTAMLMSSAAYIGKVELK